MMITLLFHIEIGDSIGIGICAPWPFVIYYYSDEWDDINGDDDDQGSGMHIDIYCVVLLFWPLMMTDHSPPTTLLLWCWL